MEYPPPSCRVSQPFPKRLCLNYFSLFRLWSCKISAYGLKLNVPPLFHLDNLQNSPAAQGSQTMRPSGHGAGLSRWDEVAQVFPRIFFAAPTEWFQMGVSENGGSPSHHGACMDWKRPNKCKSPSTKAGFRLGVFNVNRGWDFFLSTWHPSEYPEGDDFLTVFGGFPSRVSWSSRVREQCQQPWSTLLILLRTSSTGLFAAIPIMNCNDFCSKA